MSSRARARGGLRARDVTSPTALPKYRRLPPHLVAGVVRVAKALVAQHARLVLLALAANPHNVVPPEGVLAHLPARPEVSERGQVRRGGLQRVGRGRNLEAIRHAIDTHSSSLSTRVSKLKPRPALDLRMLPSPPYRLDEEEAPEEILDCLGDIRGADLAQNLGGKKDTSREGDSRGCKCSEL